MNAIDPADGLSHVTSSFTFIGHSFIGTWHIPLTEHTITMADPRKQYPVGTGVLDYFPLALMAIAYVSFVGNQQHNPGQPLHWDRSKSMDEADALMRHFLQRGTLDTDGVRHSAKLCWRALALLQKELEAETEHP